MTEKTGLEQRTAIVLGAGGGLGGAAATRLAAAGARVACWDIDIAALERARAQIQDAARADSHIASVDLSDRASIDAALESTRSALGDADILVNITGGPPPGPITGLDPSIWLAQFESMVLAVIYVTDQVLPAMRASRWGRVITSTSSGVIAPISNLGLSNSLRACLVGWSKTLANEVGGDNVTVNTVVPGRIATRRITQLDEARAEREGTSIEAVRTASTNTIPAGRYGDPDEFGNAVAFLASEYASYINGSSLRVDGGMIANV